MGKRFDRFKQGKFAQWFTKPANVAKLTAAGGAVAGLAGAATVNPMLVKAGLGMAGAALGYQGAQEANEANRQMAQQQMDFQEGMANTQYQRTRADMEAAGINPNAIYTLGAGGVPSGATAQMGNEYAQAVHSALSLYQAQADVEKTRADTLLAVQMAREAGYKGDIKSIKANLYGRGNTYLNWGLNKIGM